MNKYEIIEKMITPEELERLRSLVGWGIPCREAMETGLKNSLYVVCAVIDSEVVGAARIVGDGSMTFYIQDVIVDPEYQRSGIGLAIMGKVMDYIGEHACEGAVVGLMAAKGKEEFYEKFGFWKRPNENFGHGMIQFWKSE